MTRLQDRLQEHDLMNFENVGREKFNSEKPIPAKSGRVRRWVVYFISGCALLLIVAAISLPGLYRSREAAARATRAAAPVNEPAFLAASASPAPPMTDQLAARSGILGGAAGRIDKDVSQVVMAPMIARTASLTLLARNFGEARLRLEEVIRRHHGYSAQLAVGVESGSGNRLTASFRVPAEELAAVISEIKQIAQVEQEAQGGEEVTSQFMDLTARVSNSRRTEKTLLDILDKRAGKLSDVLEVEQELARVREEIERMEAELKGLQGRVTFASLQVELHDEYRAPLAIAPSLGTRLWNSIVDGLRNAQDSLVGLMTFVFSYGPVLLLWALMLYWPMRFAWKRLRAVGKTA